MAHRNLTFHPSFEKYVNLEKRNHTYDSGSVSRSQTTPQQATQIVWKEIVRNLNALNVVTTHINSNYHPFLAPSELAPQDDIEMFLQIPRNTMFISDREIADVLDLRPSTAISQPEEGKDALFYLRTFTLTCGQLRNIIAEWEHANMYFEEATLWIDEMKFKHDHDLIFVRYVGTAGPGKTAWGRYVEDILKRTNGIYGAFSEAVIRVCLEVHDTTKVNEISRAAIFDLIPQQDQIAEERERVLIQFFGHKTLLNRQLGGFYPSYRPHDGDQQLFVDLQTDFFNRFWTNQTEILQTETDAIRRWAQSIKIYMNENPVETLSNRFPLTDDLLGMYVR
jgi:hypothetical protein